AHETEKQAPMDRYGDPLPAGAPARLGTTRLRHTTHGVTHVLFSPDGKTLASGGSDKTFLGVRGANPSAGRLWDVATGKLLPTLEGHQNAITSLSFSPDGKRLASSGSWDETIRLWDVTAGKELRKLKCHDLTSSLSFAPDGKVLSFQFGLQVE